MPAKSPFPRRISVLARPAMLLLLAGCGPAGLYDEAPDLSGRYRLVSWKSLDVTEGRTASPPEVTGILGLVQHRVVEDNTVGTIVVSLNVIRPDGTGLSGRIADDIYSNDIYGGFLVRSDYSQIPIVSGSYLLEDGVLVTTLTRGLAGLQHTQLLPSGTIRWEPCGPTWQDCEEDR